jgi:class 3 adenylate cyclase
MWRLLRYAIGAGLAIGLACYGVVIVVERRLAPRPELALLAALLLGGLLGFCLFVAARLALRLALYDLRHSAAELTGQPLEQIAAARGDELVQLHTTLTTAIHLLPSSQLHANLAHAISAAPNLSQRFEAAAACLAAELPITAAGLFLYDHERDELLHTLSWGNVSFRTHVALVSQLPLERVLRAPDEALLAPAQAGELLSQHSGAAVDISPALCLPLWSGAESVGLLLLLSDERDSIWSERRRELARSLASQLTLAVAEARLAHSLTMEREHLGTLVALAAELAQEPARDAALNHTLRAAAALTGSDHGTLLLLNEQEEVYCRVALSEGNLAPLQMVGRSVLRNGLAGWALRERRAAVSADTERDSRWLPMPGLGDMRSALVVPLLSGDQALGVLTLAHAQPGHYAERSLALVTAVAAQATHMLARARLAQQLGQERNERQLLQHDGLERHLPPEVAAGLRDNRVLEQLDTGRSVSAVVLALGIRNFARAGEQLAPEALVAQVLQPYVEAFTEVVYRHGGYLDRCDGDLALAAFGYPLAAPDALYRALASAQQLRQAFGARRRHWRTIAGYDLVPGLAVAAGAITVGRVGTAVYGDYVLLGAAVNQARRLQALARPGEVLCSAAVAQMLAQGQDPDKNAFVVESLQPLPTLDANEQPYRLRSAPTAPAVSLS